MTKEKILYGSIVFHLLDRADKAQKSPNRCSIGVVENTWLENYIRFFIAELNMDWHMKGTSPLTSGMSSVMTTSVLSGGHMATNLSSNGDERLDLENHDPSRGLDSFSGQNFTSGLQVCEFIWHRMDILQIV